MFLFWVDELINHRLLGRIWRRPSGRVVFSARFCDYIDRRLLAEDGDREVSAAK